MVSQLLNRINANQKLPKAVKPMKTTYIVFSFIVEPYEPKCENSDFLCDHSIFYNKLFSVRKMFLKNFNLSITKILIGLDIQKNYLTQ